MQSSYHSDSSKLIHIQQFRLLSPFFPATEKHLNAAAENRPTLHAQLRFLCVWCELQHKGEGLKDMIFMLNWEEWKAFASETIHFAMSDQNNIFHWWKWLAETIFEMLIVELNYRAAYARDEQMLVSDFFFLGSI